MSAWSVNLKTSIVWGLLWFVAIFFFFPGITDPGYFPKLIGLALVLLIAFVSIKEWSLGTLLKSPILLLIILIIVCLVPSLFISDNLGDGLIVLLRFVLLALMVLVLSKSQGVQFEQLLIKSATLALLVLSIWGFAEWISALDGFVLTHKATYQVTTSMGHRNLFVQFLVILLPFGVVGLNQPKLWKLISIFSLILALFLAVVMLNRTAWFTLIIYMLVYALVKHKQEDISSKEILTRLAFFLVFSLLVGFFLVDELYTFAHQFETVFDFSKGTSRDRLLLAQRSFDLFLENPIQGIGAGMWKIDIMGFSQEGMLTDSAKVFYQRPHNDYLWILSESGVLAGLSFLALHVFGFASAFGRWRRNRTMFELSIVLSWLGFIIASVTSFPVERPEYLLILALLLVASSKPIESKGRMNFRIVLIGLCAIVLVLFSVRLKGEMEYSHGKMALTEGDWAAGFERMKKAESVFLSVDASSLPLIHHTASAQYQRGNKVEALQGFKDALMINPYHPETWNSLGICYSDQNKLDSAMLCYENAVRFTGSYQYAWFNIAFLQYNQGQWRTAFASYLKADSAQSSENYRQLGLMLSNDSLNRLIELVPDRKMMKTLEAIRNTPEWSFFIIQKCAANDISFDHQAYIDACYYMLKYCDTYDDCELVDELIERYLPHGKEELNLE